MYTHLDHFLNNNDFSFGLQESFSTRKKSVCVSSTYLLFTILYHPLQAFSNTFSLPLSLYTSLHVPGNNSDHYVVDDAAHCPQLHITMSLQSTFQILSIEHLKNKSHFIINSHCIGTRIRDGILLQKWLNSSNPGTTWTNLL